MKKRKPANFDYDFTGLAVEVTGDDLYLINGGAEVENSHQGVANAQVGDTITRSNGQVVTLKQGDIDYAQKQLGDSGPTTDAASPTPTPNTTPTPNVTMGGQSVAPTSVALAITGAATLLAGNDLTIPRLTRKEIDYIMERNSDAYTSEQELLEEWKVANEYARNENSENVSGIGYPFKSIDSAALYWAKTYGDDSIVNGHELASSIFAFDYLNKNNNYTTETYYFYNAPQEGYEVYENGELIKKMSSIDRNQYSYEKGNGIKNIRVVSAIHSHGDGRGGDSADRPSQTDRKGLKNDYKAYNFYFRKEYVVTPGGFLKAFSPEIRNHIISDQLIRDIRQDVTSEFTENAYGFEATNVGLQIFDLYKNTLYHPDVFYAHGDY